MRRVLILFSICILCFSCCACHSTPPEKLPSPHPTEIYASDEDKAVWYDALVRLLTNQREFEGAISNKGFQDLSYNENAPGIPSGLDMGLLDVTGDARPDLLLNQGGGSAGNSLYSVFDIFSGEFIGNINGATDDSWALYYDLQTCQYIPIGRFSWRIGDLGSMHFLDTIVYDENEKTCYESSLFFAEYQYERFPFIDENGNQDGYDLKLSDVSFRVNGKPSGSSDYYRDMTEFYQTHSLVPDTGIKLYYWSDVSDDNDSKQERVEKMATMLLYESGQRFINPNLGGNIHESTTD